MSRSRIVLRFSVCVLSGLALILSIAGTEPADYFVANSTQNDPGYLNDGSDEMLVRSAASPNTGVDRPARTAAASAPVDRPNCRFVVAGFFLLRPSPSDPFCNGLGCPPRC